MATRATDRMFGVMCDQSIAPNAFYVAKNDRGCCR